jgi:hypothetical protein
LVAFRAVETPWVSYEGLLVVKAVGGGSVKAIPRLVT